MKTMVHHEESASKRNRRTDALSRIAHTRGASLEEFLIAQPVTCSGEENPDPCLRSCQSDTAIREHLEAD
jgi:hypothetical protein